MVAPTNQPKNSFSHPTCRSSHIHSKALSERLGSCWVLDPFLGTAEVPRSAGKPVRNRRRLADEGAFLDKNMFIKKTREKPTKSLRGKQKKRREQIDFVPVGGWTTQLKNMRQIGSFPRGSGENKKCFKPPPSHYTTNPNNALLSVKSPLTRFVHCLFQKKPLNLSSTPSYVTHTFESHLNMDSFHVWRYLDERCMGGPISHLKGPEVAGLLGGFQTLLNGWVKRNFRLYAFFPLKKGWSWNLEKKKKVVVGVRWWLNTKDGVTFSTSPVGWGCFLLTFAGFCLQLKSFRGQQRSAPLPSPFVRKHRSQCHAHVCKALRVVIRGPSSQRKSCCIWVPICTWKLNHPFFGWKTPCFEGFKVEKIEADIHRCPNAKSLRQ